MKRSLIVTVLFLVVFVVPAEEVLAKKKSGGGLRKLKSIGDNMALQEQVWKEEAKNYQKAEEFINSSNIKQGLASDLILERCGEPVARAQGARKWVYKPPSSTFFKGEKIYFIFDEDGNLLSWEQIVQK